ncbi:MAG: hypothetical protein U5N10_13600, partial [Gemmobacter sp.]|nr:hypothetical protein [Gemmobacter sp.]
LQSPPSGRVSPQMINIHQHQRHMTCDKQAAAELPKPQRGWIFAANSPAQGGVEKIRSLMPVCRNSAATGHFAAASDPDQIRISETGLASAQQPQPDMPCV